MSGSAEGRSHHAERQTCDAAEFCMMDFARSSVARVGRVVFSLDKDLHGWSATRTNQSEFQDRYQRFRPKIGHKRAIVASAHTLALRIYEVLESALPYQPYGGTLTPCSVNRLVRHHTRRLKCLHRWLYAGTTE